jgi:polysaccharide pyruvyl transferase CsaB
MTSQLDRPGNSLSHAESKPVKVLISGYYGFDNLGDELILQVLTEQLKALGIRQGIQIIALSQNPEKTARQYGVEAISRTSLPQIMHAMRDAALFISGGGGLFQDATGPLSTVYYGGLIHLARLRNVPVCFWAQGVGPLNGSFSRRMTASALRRCRMITVRDEKSAALVRDLTGLKPEITADPVWLLQTKPPPTQDPVMTLSNRQKSGTPWRIGISLRPWLELTETRLQALAHHLITMAGQADCPVEFRLLPFQQEEDTALLEVFANHLNQAQRVDNPAAIHLIPATSVLETINQCDAIIGMRFHSLILGLLHQIPIYGLVYDPKVASLLEMFNLLGTPVHALETMQCKELLTYFENYPAVDLQPKKLQSQRNFEILQQLLDLPAVGPEAKTTRV